MAVGAIEPKFYDELLSKLNLSYEEVPQDDFENGRRIFTEKFKEKTRDEWCKVNISLKIVLIFNIDKIYETYFELIL